MDRESAVDAHTGSHLFKEVLLGMLRSKTVIYVTHQVEFLPAADQILVMKDGKITQAGKTTLLVTAGYKAATLLFNKMHLCIFRAPMSFFDATPSGRILNRASTDQSAVDLNIPYQVGNFAFTMIQLLGIIVVMSQVAWQVILVFIPVIAMCLWYQQYYIPSARELSRLSIIPQDPTMFDGTVRSNLDPLEEYTDEKIWEALDKCQLGDEVRKKEGKLDSKVTENGENWSMGQRQLVCLGRVLLKKSKVLVLDEATASVDTATDNLIQQTLRQHFTDCTVITIAHRITSILDSDMVLLLSQGLIEEYDSPTKLLEDKSSSFAQLVAEYSARSNSSFED
ncbi:hypothetical protein Q3G72_003061 [Acer saccharum]|nr:hypothetical protein Q3G72_003061 [Acer saccharum]